MSRWSLARTAILRAVGSVRAREKISPQDAENAINEAWKLVVDLRNMADTIEQDILYVSDIARDYIESGE